MNPNNHNPTLSAKELVKLLEQKSNNANDFDACDEFEKEALEGFTTYSTFEKANALIEEINIKISKKVDKKTSSKKIIWFSAAAGLVLIVILSPLFISNSDFTKTNNVAINEVKTTEKLVVTENNTDEVKQVNAPTKISFDETNKQIVEHKPVNVIGSAISEAPLDPLLKNTIVEKDIATLYYNQNNKPSTVAKSNAFKHLEPNYNTDVVNTMLDGISKDAKTVITSDEDKKQMTMSDLEIAENNKTIEFENYKAETKQKNSDGNKLNANAEVPKKNSKDKADVNSNYTDQPAGSSNQITNLNASVSAEGDGTNSVSAYYISHEIGIKEYVLKYFNIKYNAHIIHGTFEVNAKVLTNGKIKNASVMPISKDYSNSTIFLKEAINTMKDWQPATKNGKLIESDVKFILIF